MAETRVLITAPSADVATVAEIKTMLNISSDATDDLLEAMIAASVATLDPASGGSLGRALRPQTWELRLSSFPCGVIELPYPVHTAVSSVKYDDVAGDEHTLVEDTDYRVFGLGGHNKASIAPPYQGYWPIARCDRESVRIQFVSGYAGTAMPQPIKAAIALAVKDLQSTSERNLFLAREDIPGVRGRQWVVSPAAGEVVKNAIGNLLSTYRVWN